MSGIFSRTWGTTGGIPLVLLHGFTETGGVWEEAAELLGKSRRIHAPDLPGHGKTSVRPSSFSGVVKSLEAWADAEDIRDAHLLGYSMGGRLALAWAFQNPNRWRSLTLESASAGIESACERDERGERDRRLADRILEIGIRAFLNEWESQPLFDSFQECSLKRRERLRKQKEENSGVGLSYASQVLSPANQPSFWDGLATLPIPAHFIAGGQDLKYRDAAVRMARLIPGSRLTLIPSAGHRVHFEALRPYAEAVRDFWMETERCGRREIHASSAEVS